MGPIKSRPFTFGLHAMIGAGFLAATFLVKPFLPDDQDAKDNQAVICSLNTNNSTAKKSTEENLVENDLGQIIWPFIIAGVWCMVFSTGYVLLGKRKKLK